jgi:hypothetical protein
MENSRLLDVLPETPLDLRSRGVSGQHVSYNREFSILSLYNITNEKVSSIKCSNFSLILRIASMAEIGRSGKSEANVAWKFLKEGPP